jgi:hypothetical protein
MDREALSKSKATVIRRFDGSAFLISPKAKKIEFRTGTSFEEVIATVKQYGWSIGVEHLHGDKRVI